MPTSSGESRRPAGEGVGAGLVVQDPSTGYEGRAVVQSELTGLDLARGGDRLVLHLGLTVDPLLSRDARPQE